MPTRFSAFLIFVISCCFVGCGEADTRGDRKYGSPDETATPGTPDYDQYNNSGRNGPGGAGKK